MADKDRGTVYALLSDSLDEYFAPEIPDFFLMQWPNGQLVAANPFGDVIGYLAGARLQNGRVAISLFCVAAPWRGHGIGSQLLIAFRRQALMDGGRTIQLEVRTTNLGAQAFYRNRGFLPVEQLGNFYKDGGDAVRMVGPAALNS